MSHRHEINSILKQVQDWPREERQALAMELLGTTRAGGPIPPPAPGYALARQGNRRVDDSAAAD